ncbi:D-methionine transport system substrate-binding protein [Stackebrandtia albiflava]|uniref:Lipoprotein n=1 Tax=Stackebrandtia albiflava TaxID=406432 RepID=A0A562V501_9ACTN|nr:MetQ/NlpA family ABC transporter substrate-binding protein [Stackebrandtia albiflava]TWJ12902.1 D-methionine transport system substrate-binding protein [Stackebrandtia albiflava]
MKRHLAVAGIAGLTAATVLTGCASGDDDTLLVGASPTPHGQILEFISENLAADAGLDLEVEEFADYTQVNPALQAGDLDANYFQTPAYLAEYNDGNDGNLVSVAEVHVEPMGLYSNSVTSLDAIPDGAQVGIPNDASNGGRALQLLQTAGLITLAEGAGELATEDDIVDNPKNLEVVPQEAAQLPRSLEDLDLAVINGNYALEADLSPADDALAAEAGEGNPYANLLVVTEENRDDPQVQKLAELLNSPEVAQFIEDTFSDGSVIPAF